MKNMSLFSFMVRQTNSNIGCLVSREDILVESSLSLRINITITISMMYYNWTQQNERQNQLICTYQKHLTFYIHNKSVSGIKRIHKYVLRARIMLILFHKQVVCKRWLIFIVYQLV